MTRLALSRRSPDARSSPSRDLLRKRVPAGPAHRHRVAMVNGRRLHLAPTGSIGSRAPTVSTRPSGSALRGVQADTSGVEPTHRTCRTTSPEAKSGLSVAPALQLLQLWSQQRPQWSARGHPWSGGTVVRVPQLCRQCAADDRLHGGEAGVLPGNRRGRESGDGRHLPETCNDLR